MNRLHRRTLAAFLLIALLITTAGCGGGDTTPAGKETLPNQTSTTSSSQPDRADDLAVEQLRKQLKTEDKPFAVAYLGYMSSDCATVGDYIDNLDDAILQKLPFLPYISEANTIATALKGEVYCVIPTDPKAVVEVFTDSNGKDTLYEGNSAEPYLLVCNSEYSTDCNVTITDSEASTTQWSPKLDEYLYVAQPAYGEGIGPLDISPYNEMLLAYYEDMQKDVCWDVPAKVELKNTTWYWDGYTTDGNYYKYQVAFYEDTVEVQWDAGYGETTTYTNAAWDCEEGDICVLTIDFGEFAGVRKYNVLTDWGEGRMYIAADATAETLTWDSEPQYRFLLMKLKE